MAYLPLSTASLPDPVIDPAQGASPEDYFGTVTWAGNGSATKRTDIQFDGVQPDLVWLKNRTLTRDHALHDDVRGLNARIKSNNTEAESTTDAPFDTDGFGFDGVGTQLRIATTNSSYNASGSSYVAWGWKASGASGVTNTDGSITSTVSANTTSGFSIVSYTANGATSDETIGHGLGVTPNFAIIKSRNVTGNWLVEFNVLDGSGDYMYLNTTGVKADLYSTIGDSSVLNTPFGNNGNDYIAYCFHSVEGFSKFGSYVGNGSADGPFVYTGFRPAFVLIKAIDSANAWWITDTSRDTYNLSDAHLRPDTSDAEQGVYSEMDILSNGFKMRTSNGQTNASGFSYLYACFSENPFKYSNAR